MNSTIYPPHKSYCKTCKGKRTVWSPDIPRAYNKCPNCEGRGYLLLSDKFVVLNSNNVFSANKFTPIEVIQKRRGRPPSVVL